ADIRGDHDLRRDAGDVAHLLVENLHRDFVLDDVVNAGATAAGIGTRRLHHLGADVLQQLPGRTAYALGVGQVAGVLIGDARLELARRLDQANFAEILADVADLDDELPGPLRILGIVFQQRRIFLHCRTATGGVGHDGVELGLEHGVNVVARLSTRLLEVPGMQVQRSAATLTAWDMDFDAILGENANGGAI